MEPTDIGSPEYFHKVVDCQWACPAHTPVPEYIRLISAGRYNDAYMINWASNVFPGILGRTCDRPCEPACRRGRVEEQNLDSPEPVAICRLKRVAADNKTDVKRLMPTAPQALNGKKVLCIGDNLNTDIKGANIQNFKSLFILNGIHNNENNLNKLLSDYKVHADYVQSSLKW